MEERRGTLRGPEIQGMCGTFMRENREVPCPPVWLIAGRAVAGTLRW
jgi:hypothetical protein